MRNIMVLLIALLFSLVTQLQLCYIPASEAPLRVVETKRSFCGNPIA